MAADRTPFAASGTLASFDDEPLARTAFGALATCTGFASSIDLCNFREDGLPAVALPPAAFARAPELLLREVPLPMPFLAADAAAALARAGSAMPLPLLPLAPAFGSTFAEATATVCAVVLLVCLVAFDATVCFGVRPTPVWVAVPLLLFAGARDAARRGAADREGLFADDELAEDARLESGRGRAAAARATALLSFCVCERLLVTCGTRFLSRVCDGLADRQ